MRTSGLDQLRRLISGEVMGPDDPGYVEASRPALPLAAYVRPRAVVRCASSADVARTLDFARRSGIHVVPRGGGHCFAGRSSTDGIVLDLTPLRSVSISTAGVRIGAGARLQEVYDALGRHGLTLPAGCGATVGIAGLTLGGGLGVLGRTHGLTCDRLRGARVVLADGRIVDCDADHEPDLFWALRGAGGGQFGIVTTLDFAPVPAPPATRFVLTWPYVHAAAVIAAWQGWAPDAPDELSASLTISARTVEAPPTVVMFGAMVGDEARTVATLDELTELVGAPPASRRTTELAYHDLKASLRELDFGGPGIAVSKSEFFRRPIPAAGIDELLAALAANRVAGETRTLSFTPMGGAYNRVPAAATAFVHRSERFLLEHVATGDPADASTQWVRRSHAVAHQWGSGRVYPNFPDPELTDWAEAYHGTNYARLGRVKRAYDPDRVLRFHQAV